MLQRILLFIVCVSSAALVSSSRLKRFKETKRWVVTQNSCLKVLGSTNVNKFTCEISNYNAPDTILIESSAKSISLSGGISLDISSFNCHNPMMTKQLRKTLKANTYPCLQIAFISLTSLPALETKPAFINGLVDITLAGKCKRYYVNYQLSIDANKIIHLNGSREIKFSDFGLQPPKKIGGMIAAKDKLFVEFNLNLKSI